MAIQIPGPAFDGFKPLLGFVDRPLRALHGEQFRTRGSAQVGELRAEKSLAGLFEVARPASQLIFPINSAVVAEPFASPRDFASRIIEDGPGFAQVDQQCGTKRLNRINRANVGFLGYARLPLIEILLDPLRLPHEIRNMLFRNFNETLKGLRGLRKFLGKFCMFLVLPGIAQR